MTIAVDLGRKATKQTNNLLQNMDFPYLKPGFMGESSKIGKSWTFKISNLKLEVYPLTIYNLKFKWSIAFKQTNYSSESLFQHFKADFLWKVSLKILNSGIILKTFTHLACIFALCL